MTRPVGGDEYPGGVRELSLLLDTDAESGGRGLHYVYWQQKHIDERLGRVARLDSAGRLIYDTSAKIRPWVNSEIILPGTHIAQ